MHGYLFAPGISVDLTTAFDFDKVYEYFKRIHDESGMDVVATVKKSYGNYTVGNNSFNIPKDIRESLLKKN